MPVTTTLVALVAVTVSVSELPWLIELFCAEIVTVGFVVPEPTVIVTWAVVLPCELVAVAVYVVVVLGVTVIVPPVSDTVYEVLLDPVTCTDPALDAVTVRVSDCPSEMLLELTVMDTTGVSVEPAPTVMVVCAEAVVPEEPVATAVYVVVDAGVTLMVPPVSATLYFEPSEPDTLTEVALEAVTVSVSDDPAVMLLDFAAIETVGVVDPPFTVTVVWAVALPLALVAVAV